jgi:hypothetical protein
MAPPIDTTTRRTPLQTLKPIQKEERQALQQDARTQVDTLADEVANSPVNRPTAQTAADSRRSIRFDPTTQQIITRANAQVPTAVNNDGTVTITGTPDADKIRVDQSDEHVRAYYTDANGEEQLLGEWCSSDVDRVEVDGGDGDDLLVGDNTDGRTTMNAGAGNDRIVNKGDGPETSTEGATLEGGEGDDQIINTRGGATINGGAGENEIINSGDSTNIGDQGEDVDSSDFVFNAGDGANIAYQGGSHEVQSVGNANSIDLGGDANTVDVVGDDNGIRLRGSDNDLTIQGDNNGTIAFSGNNSVRIAGEGNAVDVSGTGNQVDVNGDGNTVTTDNAAGILLDNFDTLDVDGDGILTEEEIRQVPGASDIADNLDSLMFGTIQEGSNAWHGLSREDLEMVRTRMFEGETLDDISQDLMTNSWLGQEIAAQGGQVTPEAFSEAVDRYRQDNPRPDVDPMSLTPLLDTNDIGLWGNQNQVAAPTSANIGFMGWGNQITAGDNSAIAGIGNLNTINLAGPNGALAFAGYGNQVNSGGGNVILGAGDYNMIESAQDDLTVVEGQNLVNGQLQTGLSPYFAEMSPDMGLPPDLMIMLLLQQQRGGNNGGGTLV